MAFSKCAKCNNAHFELVECAPANSLYKMYFVQCSSCGSPVGVVDFDNSGAMLEKQEEKIEELKLQLQSIDYNVRQIKTKLGI